MTHIIRPSQCQVDLLTGLSTLNRLQTDQALRHYLIGNAKAILVPYAEQQQQIPLVQLFLFQLKREIFLKQRKPIIENGFCLRFAHLFG